MDAWKIDFLIRGWPMFRALCIFGVKRKHYSFTKNCSKSSRPRIFHSTTAPWLVSGCLESYPSWLFQHGNIAQKTRCILTLAEFWPKAGRGWLLISGVSRVFYPSKKWCHQVLTWKKVGNPSDQIRSPTIQLHPKRTPRSLRRFRRSLYHQAQQCTSKKENPSKLPYICIVWSPLKNG